MPPYSNCTPELAPAFRELFFACTTTPSVVSFAPAPCDQSIGVRVMDLQLFGKTALVTGASMGIGRAIAKGLAAEGVQVAAVARRTQLLEELGSEIERGQGPRPFLITQDIMAADAATQLRDAALAGLGQ